MFARQIHFSTSRAEVKKLTMISGMSVVENVGTDLVKELVWVDLFGRDSQLQYSYM